MQKSPAKFAELAKKYSEDPGSAEKGGDLGFFASGAMVQPFEEVVFKQKEGEAPALVETQFGFHIIRLEARREAGLRPYSEVKELLQREAVQQIVGQKRTAKVASIVESTQIDHDAIAAFAATEPPKE